MPGDTEHTQGVSNADLNILEEKGFIDCYGCDFNVDFYRGGSLWDLLLDCPI